MNICDSKGKVIATVTAADPNMADVDEGVWLEVQADDGTRPTLCLVKQRGKSSRNPIESAGRWYLGVYRDARKPGVACDLAITFGPEGPVLQVVKGKEVRQVNLFDHFAS